MNSVVIYASRHGNTQKVAEAIVAELALSGAARLVAVDDAPSVIPTGTDLVVIGGPTEAHRMTEPLVRFFERVEKTALNGVPTAAFCTRLHGPRWLWGSAATAIADRLQALGADVIAEPENFFVTGPFGLESGVSELRPGEFAHATEWARSVAGKVRAKVPAGV